MVKTKVTFIFFILFLEAIINGTKDNGHYEKLEDVDEENEFDIKDEKHISGEVKLSDKVIF